MGSSAEARDFPEEAVAQARAAVTALASFADDEAQCLADGLLRAGGLEPGRIRRAGGLG